ncbi:carboxypeptidase-like regulatory domain-containing protein [Hymenobacter gummosus]|uniref:Carboxypeptidase-like regulatory domain-containing protein n=1 Tax=Hymenobacter gummosus TaxID=1776032 RepID=A0A431TYE6_9BACT|nr:carboxypeptidase-like regulatory domain-containing protein [Hymenobacter gummosus]RTQ47190.1 carboxypeptidase-like regulatory domain-containing protein [Hymenobacter gummosus]
MRTLFSTLVACSLLLAGTAGAQTLATTNAGNQPVSPNPEIVGLIKGQVLNEDGQPLPGATILIKGTKNVFSTNAEGAYSFPSTLPAQRVQISLLGYTEAEMSVRVGSANAVTLQLLPGTRIKHGGRNNGKLLAVGKEE